MSNQNQGNQGQNQREKEGQSNFKNDQERARDAARKSGEHSHGGSREKENE